MEELRSFIVGQADFLLFLHGLAFAMIAAVCLALGRIERAGLPWRALAVFAMTWGIAEWLEMVFLGVEVGPVLPLVQMSLTLVALVARVEFGRVGTAVLGTPKLSRLVTLAFALGGISGAFRGTQALWITLDSAAALATLWDVVVLMRYRRRRYPGSLPLLLALAGLGFYMLGTAIPVLHVTWFLPGIAGGFPEGQLLWIASASLVGFGLMSHYGRLWRERFGDRPVYSPGLTHWKLVGSMAAILAAGWAAAFWGGRTVIQREKTDLLHTAQMVAIALDGDHLRQLEGVPEDRDKPTFGILSRRVAALAAADPRIRFMYGLVQRDGRLYFTVGSAPELSPDHSSPDSDYRDAPQAVYRVFREGRAEVTGPFTDRWGTFISAFVPLMDQTSGRVVHVIGADMNYEGFYGKVAAQRLVFILLTLLVALSQMGAFTFRQVGRESAEALMAAEKRYTHMFLNHNSIMLVLDPATGCVRDANKAAAAFYGIPRQDLLDKNCAELTLLPPDAIREEMDRTLNRGENAGEITARRADGSIRQVEWRCVPIEIDGRPHLIATVRDITDEKRAAKERKRLEAQMVEAQKLESLGVLAGGIAHDFNNILQGILGNADLALRSMEQESPVRKRLEGIRESSRRAADLCKLMLAYSGKGAFSVGKMNLASLVREMVRMLEASFPKKVSVVCDLAEDLPPVEGDPAQIRQVIMNLLLNASEAIGEAPGTITVTARPAECPEDEDATDRKRPCFLLEISDTGCGMDAATRKRIFEPFFTTKFAGRGLGLAAAQGIIRSHRGAIIVASTPGRGTTFRVYLPSCPGPSPMRSDPALRPLPQRRGGTVLLVDDEEDVREVASGMLEHLGFRVEMAADGAAALDVLERGEPLLAVLLDMTMPEVDGAETLRQIRVRRPDLPVILVSGYDERDLLKKFSVEGMAGFLHKPFTLDSLAKAIASALADHPSPPA